MTPNQPALPPEAAPLHRMHQPPPAPPHQEVPEIANPNYGSGGGIFGTISDLWQQLRNPYYGADELPGEERRRRRCGSGTTAAAGYVSINAPGSEARQRLPDPSAPHPALARLLLARRAAASGLRVRRPNHTVGLTAFGHRELGAHGQIPQAVRRQLTLEDAERGRRRHGVAGFRTFALDRFANDLRDRVRSTADE